MMGSEPCDPQTQQYTGRNNLWKKGEKKQRIYVTSEGVNSNKSTIKERWNTVKTVKGLSVLLEEIINSALFFSSLQ